MILSFGSALGSHQMTNTLTILEIVKRETTETKISKILSYNKIIIFRDLSLEKKV
jgi:hypothetical protein